MSTTNNISRHLSLFLMATGLTVSTTAFALSNPFSSGNGTLCDNITNEFNLDHAIDQERVQTQSTWYKNNPQYLAEVMERAEPYLYYIAEEIKTRDLPMELILIPVIESTYDPHARSHAGAVGLWQLMPATARHYGVEQSGWYDGRRDITTSTSAALDHFEYLNNLYDGDWLLVMAAYNAGEGTVSRAKRNAGTDDYWAMSSLPRETRNYVPKILGLAHALAHHSDELRLPGFENKPQVAAVDIDIDTYLDLTIAANLAQVELTELHDLNPGFSQPASAGSPEALLLPVESAKTFETALAAYTPEERSSATMYTVQSGDTLSRIAKTHGVTVAALQQHNALKSTTIQVGQNLNIPATATLVAAATSGTGEISYVVRAGDSLSRIANQFKVAVQDLIQWNNLDTNKYLQPGQQLVLYI